MQTESLNLFDEDAEAQETHRTPRVGKVCNFFESPDSFYKVVLVKISETNIDWHEDEIVVTGSFGDIKEEQAHHCWQISDPSQRRDAVSSNQL